MPTSRPTDHSADTGNAVTDWLLVQLDRQSRRFSQARIVTVLTTLGVVVLHLGYGLMSGRVAWGGALLGALAFVGLVLAHDRHERVRQRALARRQLEREHAARLGRDWAALSALATSAGPDDTTRDASNVPVTGPATNAPQADHQADFVAAAGDLDLVGDASLRQLLGRTASPAGDRQLRAWLQTATREAPPDVAARQQAVAELAGDQSLRTALLVEGMAAGPLRRDTTGAVQQWVDAPPTMLGSRGVAWVFALIPLCALALVAADRGGARVAGGWVALVSISWVLRWLLHRAIAPAFAGADALSGEARRYRMLFGLWEGRSSQAPWLLQRQRCLTDGIPASTAFTRLARSVDLSDLRWSHLPHVFVHSVTGWDLHVACALERWRGQHGRRVHGWFAALADLDAASTLGSLGALEPGWSLPSIDAARTTIDATALAHPLLPLHAGAPSGVLAVAARHGRVANDVAIGPPGRVLVVTGSNMSGKSTLLRAIGLNAVLAQMGAPVCASSMALPPVRLETSLRLTDSLAAGVSYFMAALLRLKAVVAAADGERPDETSPRVLYLLDEVLQGTNSEERQVAVRHIVTHLVGTEAIGALTTHDLHLVQTPEFRAHADHVHFAEHVDTAADGEPRLTFDYRLAPGPARSRNALALVRLVGLGAVSIAPLMSGDGPRPSADE